IGLNGPFMMFSSSALLLRLLYYRKLNRYEVVFYVSVFIFSLVQAICIIYNHNFHSPVSHNTHEWLYQTKDILKIFFIYFYFGNILTAQFPKILLFFSVLMLMATFSFLLTKNLPYRYYMILSWSVAATVFSAAMVKVHDPRMITPYGAGGRYHYIPYGCIFIAYIFLAWSSRKEQRYFGVFI